MSSDNKKPRRKPDLEVFFDNSSEEFLFAEESDRWMFWFEEGLCGNSWTGDCAWDFSIDPSGNVYYIDRDSGHKIFPKHVQAAMLDKIVSVSLLENNDLDLFRRLQERRHCETTNDSERRDRRAKQGYSINFNMHRLKSLPRVLRSVLQGDKPIQETD